MWANNHLFAEKFLPEPSEKVKNLLDTKQMAEQRQQDLLEKREQGFYNTGTKLTEEMRSNLFMVAFLETIINTDNTPLCDWVTNGFAPWDYENMEREQVS